MERFLKAKHWQLFIVMYGIPIFLQIVMLVVAVSQMIRYADVSSMNDTGVAYPQGPPEALFKTFMIFLPLTIISIVPLFLWQWSVGTRLQKNIPDQARMKEQLFRFFMISPLIYFALIIILVLYIFSNISSGPEHFVPGPFFFILIALMIPLHLFTMFCLFYNIFFVAKTIKTAELQRKATFSDFGLEFVLVWFLPIGIWFLQPRINKLVDSQPAKKI